jgi:hypothetical protein
MLNSDIASIIFNKIFNKIYPNGSLEWYKYGILLKAKNSYGKLVYYNKNYYKEEKYKLKYNNKKLQRKLKNLKI